MLIDAHVHTFVLEEFPPGERWAFANRWAWMPPKWSSLTDKFLLPPEDEKGPYRDASCVFPRVGANVADPDATKLMEYMDRNGIEKSVTMMVDWGVAWGEEAEFNITMQNAHAGELKKKHPGRYYFCAGVDPRRRTAADIAEKAITEHGAVGIKFMAANGFYPDDPICYPVYEVARAHKVPIVVHTGLGDAAAFVDCAHPWKVEGPAKLFPDVQFVLAHAGGGMDGLWREVLLMHGCVPNIAVDLAEWQYPIRPSGLDSGREQEFIHVLNILRRRIGPQNIMMGTDYMPDHNDEIDTFFVDLFKDLPARAKQFGYFFREEEADAIRGGNASRIFGLSGK